MNTNKHNDAINLVQAKEMGNLFFESGMFPAIKSPAQAAVKILAGAALGIDPVQAVIGVEICRGMVVLNAQVMAALIRRSGICNFRIEECDENRCVLFFYRHGSHVGTSTFTVADAEADGSIDSGEYWPDDMPLWLLSRALGIGAREHCSDLFSSPVFTPEEIHTDMEGAFAWEYGLADLWSSEDGETTTALPKTMTGVAN